MITANAATVIERRIAAKDDNGNPLETADQVFVRVADAVAKGTPLPEHYGPVFYRMLTNLDFIPNSPCLVNAGRELGQLSACFVLPVGDSIEEIFDSVKHTAIIHKSGGGTGFAFSDLRKKGSTVKSTSGVASGPVSFMKIFDAATEEVKQGGTRRGANMGILSIDHPDIWEFIHVKQNRDRLQNFNISVAMTDEFMRAVRGSRHMQWKESGHTVEEIWEALIHNAWLTGDPGVVFIDKINASRANPVPDLGPIKSTNPCGEQPLYDYDSCNLGSINLSNFYDPASPSNVDWQRLAETVGNSVHFLDAVITVNKYPLPQIEDITKSIRRIGLGVMGWADLLYKIGLAYDSLQARLLGEEIMAFIDEKARIESQVIAMKTTPFPLWERSIYADDAPIRNATRTTIAPTGTISIIAGCSSGIEPMFALAFKRSHHLDRNDAKARHEMFEVNELFKQYAILYGFYSDELIQYLAEGGRLCERPEVPDEAKKIFVTAHDIDPTDHVLMQAAFQRHTDNAVSKTINFPNHATELDVELAYIEAYDQGCLGITVYRDGSHDNQVLGFVEKAHDATPLEVEAALFDAPEPSMNGASFTGMPDRSHWRWQLPLERHAHTRKMSVDGFEFYLIQGFYPDGSLGETFITGSGTGSTISGLLDTVAMLTSFCLQHGVPVEQLFSKLQGQRFEPAGRTNVPEVPVATSIVDLIARYILTTEAKRRHEHAEVLVEREAISIPTAAAITVSHVSGMLCPDCQGILAFQEGCLNCTSASCGYSRCG